MTKAVATTDGGEILSSVRMNYHKRLVSVRDNVQPTRY